MCLTLGVLKILQYDLSLALNNKLSIKQVLDKLEQYVKARTNEALRRKDLFNCKQKMGDPQ